MRSHHVLVLSLLPAWVTPLAAQSVIVPPGYEQVDAGTLTEVAGFTQRFRQQILIRAGVAAALAGHSITELTFRRDGQHGGALTGGSADIVVTLSESSRDPSQASPDFARNHGASVQQVFAGRISIPASPALSHRNAATWSAPDVVSLPLTTPWPYAGGHLCVDLSGSPVPGAASGFWPVDAELQTTDATVTYLGTACDPRLRLRASRATLVPGGTVRFVSSGPPGSPGAVMIGMPPQVPGIDLGFVNAPGCELSVFPAVAVGVSHSNPVRGSYGDAALRLTLPASSSLLSSAFGSQLLNYGNPTTASGIATSTALALQLASTPPRFDVVQVRTGPLGVGVTRTEGEVIAAVAPVLRLSAR